MANEKAQGAQQPQQSGQKLVRIQAVSLAPPGHWRGGQFWVSREVTTADVTEKQAAEIRADKRIAVYDGNPPKAEDVLAEISLKKAKEEALRKAQLDQMTMAELADKSIR